MRAHLFYAGLLVIFLVALATIIPDNSITGRATDYGKLCDEDAQCGDGLVCCNTTWESGVCHNSTACAEINQLSRREVIEPQETPYALQNIAWKTFGIPLLLSLAIALAIILGARRKML